MSAELAELRSQLALLSGKECWSVLAGAGTGSTLHLHFGARIPRRVPNRNTKLSPLENNFEGELSLFVLCAWRLEQSGAVLCGSTDDDRNDGPMVAGLRRLVGQFVTSVETFEPVPDLTVRLSGDLCLRLFCDQTNLETNDSNYHIRAGERITVVGARGAIDIEIGGAD